MEGNTALGLGMASSSTDGERVFRLASAISPGLSDIGVQASYQMRVGRAAPASLKLKDGREATEASTETEAHQSSPVPFAFWKAHGFRRILQLVPGRLYTAMHGDRTFRIAVADSFSDDGTAWAVAVDEMQRDGAWRHVTEMDALDLNKRLSLALAAAIDALGKYVQN
jgi:hypothetical protein